MKLLLLAHAAATLIMLGVILVVQVVHYPLFAQVGTSNFTGYEAAHTRLITVVVFPPMVVELITGLLLVLQRPPGLPAWLAWTGLTLIGVIWLSTALLQVPLHRTLSLGFDGAAHERLVVTNWIRTVAWSLRTVLVLLMLSRFLKAP